MSNSSEKLKKYQSKIQTAVDESKKDIYSKKINHYKNLLGGTNVSESKVVKINDKTSEMKPVVVEPTHDAYTMTEPLRLTEQPDSVEDVLKKYRDGLQNFDENIINSFADEYFKSLNGDQSDLNKELNLCSKGRLEKIGRAHV